MSTDLSSLRGSMEFNTTLPQDYVELRDLKALGFARGKLTKARRSSPVPQLECLSSLIDCQNADIDFIYCENVASLAESASVFWKCKADRLVGYEIHSVNVECEGYRYPGDTVVLKGSCGLKYHVRSALSTRPATDLDHWVKNGFLLVWCSVAIYLLISFFRRCSFRNRLGNGRIPNLLREPDQINQADTDPNRPPSIEAANNANIRQRATHRTHTDVSAPQDLVTNQEPLASHADSYPGKVSAANVPTPSAGRLVEASSISQNTRSGFLSSIYGESSMPYAPSLCNAQPSTTIRSTSAPFSLTASSGSGQSQRVSSLNSTRKSSQTFAAQTSTSR